MCESNKRRKEALHGKGGKPAATVGLQRGQREQDSGTANGEHVYSLFANTAVVLLDLTVISNRLP